jgi:hypothetical protein
MEIISRDIPFLQNYNTISFFPLQENCRLWGEEKEEGAIWGVYLKKVRYQRPSAIVQIVQASGNHNLTVKSDTSGERKLVISSNGSHSSYEESQEEIAHLMWETVKVKVLKAGSLEKVVEAIANDDSDVQVNWLACLDQFVKLKRVIISEVMLSYLNIILTMYMNCRQLISVCF